jgi:hypothetical protein
MRRRGASLIELLLVVGVLAALIALLLPAVQRVRGAATRVQALNALRQLGHAVHLTADARNGFVPGVAPPVRRQWLPEYGIYSNVSTESFYPALREVFGPPRGYRDPATGTLVDRVPAFLSPVPPAGMDAPPAGFNSTAVSYLANAWLFRDAGVNLVNCAPDGLSNTLALAEHHGRCTLGPDPLDQKWVSYFTTQVGVAANTHRPTFADGGPVMGGANEGDVFPVVTGGAARPSVPGLTFRVVPREPSPCAGWVPETYFPDGLLVGLGDGSVRTVRPGVAEGVFWAAVTPAGGEVAGDL